MGKQKHPAMTPYPQGAWKAQNDPSEATLLDGSGRSSKLGFLTGPSPLIGVNFASLRSVFWRFGARRLKKRIKGELLSKKRRKVSRRLKKQIKVALLSKKRTPESAPGRPKPFRAKVEYSNQLKSYEKSKAFFSAFLVSLGSKLRSL